MLNGSAWRGFAAWVVAAALFVFSLLAMASIGLFLLPLALVGCWLAARASRDALDLLGGLAGAGLVCLVIVALGNFDPMPWLGVGLALTLGAPAAFAILRCRDAHARLG